MFDESLLDDPDALARADSRGLLRGAAAAGARVRTAARLAAEAGRRRPRTRRPPPHRPGRRPRPRRPRGRRPPRRPRACAGLPRQPAAPRRPHRRRRRRWTLPGWAGPLDLLLLATDDGTEPGLDRPRRAGLPPRLHRRRRRPAPAPLAEALAQVRGFALPFAAARRATRRRPADRATPAPSGPCSRRCSRSATGSACSRAAHAPPGARRPARQRRRPLRPRHRHLPNPAKTLAAELADALPLLWSQGPLAAAVARRFATFSPPRRPPRPRRRPARRAHRPRRAAGQPPSPRRRRPRRLLPRPRRGPRRPRPRIVLLQRTRRRPGRPSAASSPPPAPAQTRHEHPVSDLDAPRGHRLDAAAELLALTDFATAYLAVPHGPALALTVYQLPPRSRDGSTAAPDEKTTTGMNRLTNTVRPYAWGSTTAIPELLGTAAHRRTPGRTVDGRPPRRALPDRPRRGTPSHSTPSSPPTRAPNSASDRQRFGPRLPFLLKVLAAGSPLSVQVHPDLDTGPGRLRRRGGPRHPRSTPPSATTRTPTTSPR